MQQRKASIHTLILGILRRFVFVACSVSLFAGCASQRLQSYYESGPVGERQASETDFKNSEELDQMGQSTGAQ